jgi:hypothetical protein
MGIHVKRLGWLDDRGGHLSLQDDTLWGRSVLKHRAVPLISVLLLFLSVQIELYSFSDEKSHRALLLLSELSQLPQVGRVELDAQRS